ncbi:MAG: MaoC family dehydratase N-terminal domain-containing protein [Myxococcales bacterium]|nr:MaoC family dehydratase N-terminal domain-containing protein [Myxococcales bacterium]
MALRPEAVGATTAELIHEYDWRDVALYALGVGATLDELDFLYEKRGPKVLPTYAVIPTFPACEALFETVGGDFLGVVHGAQKITLHRPFAPAGRLTTVGKVAGVYDLKRLAQAVFVTETRDAAGELLCETEWLILYRFDGGFGGERPPKSLKIRAPEAAPDFRVAEQSRAEQAALYRLSGDLNPLHVDPEVAAQVGFDRPILHGLCTFGYAGRAVLASRCGGDPARLRELYGQFKRPVWPGDTLITSGFAEDGRLTLTVDTEEQPGEVAFAGYAIVD